MKGESILMRGPLKFKEKIFELKTKIEEHPNNIKKNKKISLVRLLDLFQKHRAFNKIREDIYELETE